jgi:prevent-host-death family protein
VKTFSMSDLQRAQGDVVDAAARAPVALTKRGKERLVMMSREHYDKLTAVPQDPRRAFYTHETPPELAAMMSDAIEQWLREHGQHDDP